MVKQAIKNGTLLRCDVPSMNGIIYQVVKFDTLVFLVSLDRIAEGVETLDICDYWRVTGKYLRENFTVVNA